MSTTVKTSDTATKDEERTKLDLPSFKKIVPNWDAAKTQIKDWQAQGLKVGFTNGAFDIIHVGHVNLLELCAQKCDRLVLGLNNDESIRLYKSKDRPINPYAARAGVIAGLESIDLVVQFGATQAGEDTTPSEILDFIRPNVIFKGGDYTIDQMPEAKVVLAYGGEVEIMNLFEGYSTSAIIAKSKKV